MGKILLCSVIVAAEILLAGCASAPAIIVRYEDLKSDLFILEATLRTDDWQARKEVHPELTS